MQRPPVSGRLLSSTVAWRAFGLLGPVESIMAMSAFIAVLLSGGWSWGTTPDPTLLTQASGAYFITVVAGQMGNALACRSSTLTIRHLGLRTNPTLLWATLAALVIALTMVFLPALAEVLGQAAPPAIGWVIAGAAPGVLLLVDAADKALRRRRYAMVEPSGAGGAGTTAAGLSG